MPGDRLREDFPSTSVLFRSSLTLVNLGARVAILPVLVSTLPDPPPLGAVTMASFALLYSQLILPTPSGAGAVAVAFHLRVVLGEVEANNRWRTQFGTLTGNERRILVRSDQIAPVMKHAPLGIFKKLV